ncbi:MAG: M48 family metallopeptidase [Rhodoferax sp.]|nr:M48 family metallopeptidase [Rhodoferax sp.]
MLPLLRYTLDLFDVLPKPAATPGKSKPKRLVTPADIAQTAPENIASPLPQGPFVAGQTLQQVVAPVAFAHPQATREVRLGDAVVAYAFARARRRTIGFIVGAEGLVVRAPRWTPLYEVDAALKEKASWILRKLQETRERQQRHDDTRIAWADGAELPYLGDTIRIQLDPEHGFAARGAQLDEQTLRVGLPHSATQDQIRDAVQAWLMRQAQALFKQRLDHFAVPLGVKWSKLSLSNAGTRWGSAKSDGSIRLHWRLVHFRPEVIDYVVAHELSHLRVMDHSPRFWDTVRSVVPDFAELRGQLKDEAIPKW